MSSSPVTRWVLCCGAIAVALSLEGCANDGALKQDAASSGTDASADKADDTSDATATGLGALYLEVRSLEGEQPAVQLGPLSPAAIDGTELVVPTSRTVSGQVLLGDATRPAEAARVRFVALDGIPGRETLLEAVTGTVASGSPGLFQIDLPPGRYDVTATPAAVDSVGGPTELLRPNLSLEALAAGPLSLSLTAPEKLLTLDGVVQINRVGTTAATPGITVRAVFEDASQRTGDDEDDDDTDVEQNDEDTTSDDTSDDDTSGDDEDVDDKDVDPPNGDDVLRLLTHPAAARPVVTDAEGHYRLLIAPMPDWAPPRRIRLLYGPGSEEQPGVLAGPLYLLSGARLSLLNDPSRSSADETGTTTPDTSTDTSLSGQASTPSSAVPLPKPRRVMGTVEAVDRFGVPRPAAGALVSLHAREGEPLWDARTVVTDASGRWETWLLPVAYDIVALPQAGAEQPTDLCRAASSDTPYVLRCAPPIRLAGSVVDLQQREAAATDTSTSAGVVPETVSTVELVRRPDRAWDTPWRLTLGTAVDGSFVADLPSGIYDLRVTPPPLAGAPTRPAALLDGVIVPPASTGAVAPVTITLPVVRPLACRLVRSPGDPGFTASVEAYRLGPDGAPRLVGRGVSQRDGSLLMSLSPEAP